MTVQFYPNGIGGSAPGDSLDLARPLQTTGNIWYVNSVGGVDAASPAGQNREKPLATLAQAVTNAVDDDIVVFLAGHTQVLVGIQTIGKAITFIGEGTTSGKPAVSFQLNSAGGNMLALTVAGIELRNIYFQTNAQSNGTARIAATSTDAVIRGCYFDCGPNDVGAALQLVNGSRARIESCTFISIATVVTAQPKAAIIVTGTLVGLTIKDTVVSAGTVGYSNYAAIDLSAATVSLLRAEGLSLLLGSDVALGANTTGRVNVQLSTGGSRVAWG